MLTKTASTVVIDVSLTAGENGKYNFSVSYYADNLGNCYFPAYSHDIYVIYILMNSSKDQVSSIGQMSLLATGSAMLL